MKQIIVTLIILSVCTAATVVIAQSQGPEEIKYPVKMGTVSFNHAGHQQTIDCASCHHTGDYISCKNCHGVKTGIPTAKNAFHDQCKSCHKEQKKRTDKM